ncbi:MAG: high potential iron sulfur protein [Caulobacteraceae bacterium]|nr:high potential iron sulfur protein [Caulobacteraceae bacterium]
MPKMTSLAGHSETTRRGLVSRLVVAGAGGVVGASLMSRRAAAAPAKLAPNEIGYQASPKGSARCELCVNWQAPNACKVVAGAISPSGWCGLYVRRS